MRPVLLTSEPADVRRGSGTAVAVGHLVEAMAANGVQLAVVRAHRHPLGHTVARARFNREVRWTPAMYDAVLGVGGDGHEVAARNGLPFIALPKALYDEVWRHERGVTRALLRRHAAWERRAAVAAQLVIVPSRFAADVVHQSFAVPWDRIAVIPEPFPVARWRSRLPKPAREGRRALLVAHMYPRKRVHDALSAWPLVRRTHPDATLDIAGDGPTLASVRRAAAGIAGVTVHGHVEEEPLRALYARADVAVSASAHETFGYAVLEAMAAGLPIVAAAAPAVVELCEGAVAAAVPVGDVPALARAIAGALQPDVAAAAAEANPRRAAACELEPIGAAYLDAVTRLLG